MHAHTPNNPDQLIHLSDVCAELLAAGIDPPKGGVRWLQTAAGSAKFPAQKRNAKWFIRRADLPRVAAAYGASMPAEGGQ